MLPKPTSLFQREKEMVEIDIIFPTQKICFVCQRITSKIDNFMPFVFHRHRAKKNAAFMME